MKVPTHAPNPRRQKQVRPLPSPAQIGGDNIRRPPPPYGAFPLGLPEDVALVVAVVVEEYGEEAEEEDAGGEGGGNVGAVLGEVEGVAGVDAGDPDQATPAEIVPGPVVLNVHGAHVPHLPVEELRDVDELEHDVDRHPRLHDAAVDLHVLVGVAEDPHRPVHHAEPAVGHLLDVESPELRVQVDPPIVVDDDAPVATAVRRAVALHQEPEAERQGDGVEGAYDLGEFIVDQAGVDEPVVRADEQSDERYEVAREPVRLVDGHVAGGGYGRLEPVPRHRLGQKRLKGKEAEDELQRRRVPPRRPDLEQETTDPHDRPGPPRARSSRGNCPELRPVPPQVLAHVDHHHGEDGRHGHEEEGPGHRTHRAQVPDPAGPGRGGVDGLRALAGRAGTGRAGTGTGRAGTDGRTRAGTGGGGARGRSRTTPFTTRARHMIGQFVWDYLSNGQSKNRLETNI